MMNGMRWILAVAVFPLWASGAVESRLVRPGTSAPDVIELRNDGYNEAGGPAYLQQGFVTGEKAGVWVKVPPTVKKFKVDYFRVLVGGARVSSRLQVFFEAGTAGADQYSPYIPKEVVNAANITPGPYWNDIPVMGADGQTLRCPSGGELVGAALEFTHDGIPSVYRDADGLSNVKGNTLFAIPGGWNYSVAFGLEGDWVLRIIGHEAKPGDCQ